MKDIENRKDIVHLIDHFYQKVIKDEMIGFFFTRVIELNWEVHIPVMYDFWEGVLLGAAKYKGNPMIKHIVLNQKHQLRKEHFDRWLELWKLSVNENFSGNKATEAIQKAQQIGSLMQMKINQEKIL